MILDGGRLNDERRFLYKSFIGRAVGGAVKGFVTGGPLSAVAGGARGLFKQPARTTISRTLTARPTFEGQQGKELGRELKFGGAEPPPGFGVTAFAPGTECQPPRVLDPSTGLCLKPKPGIRAKIERFLPGGRTGFEANGIAPVGDAVMGQYGAALEPGVMTIARSVCLRGMQLAKDGLCYNKGAITNSQRMWPRGRRPLLTGGDMRAIGIAARAGAKLDRTTKRLRGLGMMKALPKPRKAPAHAHAKPQAAVSV